MRLNLASCQSQSKNQAALRSHTWLRWNFRIRPSSNMSPFVQTNAVHYWPDLMLSRYCSTVGARPTIGWWDAMSSCPTIASFLCAREIAGHAAETMGSFLACGGNPPLAASSRKAGLAPRFFRPAITPRRKLSPTVALSLGKSYQGRTGETAGRLAVSR